MTIKCPKKLLHADLYIHYTYIYQNPSYQLFHGHIHSMTQLVLGTMEVVCAWNKNWFPKTKKTADIKKKKLQPIKKPETTSARLRQETKNMRKETKNIEQN